jgi:hypothetical protein
LCWQSRATSAQDPEVRAAWRSRRDKQRTRVIVAADHGGDFDALDLGQDGLDLVEWIGGEIVAAGGLLIRSSRLVRA